MSIAYDSFLPILPPRAEKALPPSMLGTYEVMGWWGQTKKNGSNCVTYIEPGGKQRALKRDCTPLESWKPLTTLGMLPLENWNAINSEWLDEKQFKGHEVHYIHDILVYNGRYLTGTTYAERHGLLLKVFPDFKVAGDHLVVDDRIWIARNWRGEFKTRFDNMTAWEDEGIVLKNPQGHLQVRHNGRWTVKSRRYHKNASW